MSAIPDTPAADVEPAPEERRQTPRTAVFTPSFVIPIAADGNLLTERSSPAVIQDVSTGGLGLKCDKSDPVPAAALLVCVQGTDGSVQCEGVEVSNLGPAQNGKVRVGGKFGGLGHVLLEETNLQPVFSPEALTIKRRFPEEVLRNWEKAGILEPAWWDRVELCPKCHGLPSFRPGCRQCGSGRVQSDRLLHHFACAHVGVVRDFEAEGGLICPKCRAHSLVLGADCEYVTGPYRCLDCQWSDTTLEQVGQCLRCGFRFPQHQAFLLELRGYRAHRLDPLALVAPAR